MGGTGESLSRKKREFRGGRESGRGKEREREICGRVVVGGIEGDGGVG